MKKNKNEVMREKTKATVEFMKRNRDVLVHNTPENVEYLLSKGLVKSKDLYKGNQLYKDNEPYVFLNSQNKMETTLGESFGFTYVYELYKTEYEKKEVKFGDVVGIIPTMYTEVFEATKKSSLAYALTKVGDIHQPIQALPQYFEYNVVSIKSTERYFEEDNIVKITIKKKEEK